MNRLLGLLLFANIGAHAQVTGAPMSGSLTGSPLATDNDGFKRRPREIPWKIWWVAMLAVLWALDGHAQVTLEYTGQPMQLTLSQYAPATYGKLVTGTIILAQPLALNGTQEVVPLSWSFSGDMTIPFANTAVVGSSFPAPPLFSFTTVNGVITAWSIFAQGIDGAGPVMTLNLTSSGDTFDFQVGSQDCQYLPSKCFDVFGANTLPGAWSIPQAQVVSEMAAMQSQLNATQKQLATAQTDATSYANGYLAANAIVTELNAFAVWARGAIASCRANKGVC
jgi:hypothetical protein